MSVVTLLWLKIAAIAFGPLAVTAFISARWLLPWILVYTIGAYWVLGGPYDGAGAFGAPLIALLLAAPNFIAIAIRVAALAK
ncbi:hypothetical protein [Sphingobium sp. Sx8-8]|uniref:hypothetical protein n=1 Tax=Sphingobium sp. Sx8-8 TaxID=2933617 RepID=UPI001F58684D|nr:hypothetical protein [Sphingobium sp. Sx8-8]